MEAMDRITQWRKAELALPLGITVVVCTYNGAERLANTLQHLAAQGLPTTQWELLLVNNASTDATASLGPQLWKQTGCKAQARFLEQPTPGKSHALMLAFQQAKYRYIIICDDDNWLSPNYLQLALEIMENHPDYGIVGGRAEAVADEPLPEWFYEHQYAYACGCPHSVSANFTGTGMMWGAGMVLRTLVAKAILNPCLPTSLTGRLADQLTAGEDDEKCVRTWLMGFYTYFDYRLMLWHYMPARRLNEAYLTNLLKGFVNQGALIAAYRRTYNYNFKYKRSYHWLFQLPAWLYHAVAGNRNKRRISAGYLFLSTNIKFWCTPEINKAVSFFNQSKSYQPTMFAAKS